jgi:hypothetical protein
LIYERNRALVVHLKINILYRVSGFMAGSRQSGRWLQPVNAPYENGSYLAQDAGLDMPAQKSLRSLHRGGLSIGGYNPHLLGVL